MWPTSGRGYYRQQTRTSWRCRWRRSERRSVPKGEPGLFIPYCAKDFLDGTQMLDPWEELAYRRICDMIYVTNDRLIDDDRKLAWATKTGRRWPAIKAVLTGGDKPKLQVVDGRITNIRCQSALGTAAKNIAQKVGAGKASAATGKSLENLKQHRTDDRQSVRKASRTDDRTNHLTNKPSKLASLDGSRELPREWAEAAAAKRAKDGLPQVDLPAEWTKFIAKADEPTEARWRAWALKARQQRSGNGSTDPGGLPEAPWPQRCRSFAKGRRWEPDWGPPPGEPGCWAPADLAEQAIAARASTANGKHA